MDQAMLRNVFLDHTTPPTNEMDGRRFRCPGIVEGCPGEPFKVKVDMKNDSLTKQTSERRGETKRKSPKKKVLDGELATTILA